MARANPPQRDNPFAPEPVRQAAVLASVFDDAGTVRVAMIKRPRHSNTHAGEVAFPGGKFEPHVDADLRATALREAAEEIGIDRERTEVLAELDTGATVVTGFMIAPFVAVTEWPVGGWITDANEVEAMVCPSLASLYAPGNYRQERWDIPAREGWPLGVASHPMYFFEIEGETVWGATARVLCDFLCVAAGLAPLGYQIEHRIEPQHDTP